MLSLAAAATIRPAAPVRLLLSNRTADEVPFRPEFEQLSHAHPDLRITSVVTSDSGRITAEQLREQAVELPDAVFYVTGPDSLVTDVTAALATIGVPRNRVRLSKQSLPFPRKR